MELSTIQGYSRLFKGEFIFQESRIQPGMVRDMERGKQVFGWGKREGTGAVHDALRDAKERRNQEIPTDSNQFQPVEGGGLIYQRRLTSAATDIKRLDTVSSPSSN